MLWHIYSLSCLYPQKAAWPSQT